MEMGIGGQLHIAQGQQLQLNQDMRQSLQVLQLPLPDLREYLIQQQRENPLLEIGHRQPAAEPWAVPSSARWKRGPMDCGEKCRAALHNTFHLEFDPDRLVTVLGETLREHLEGQLLFLALPPTQAAACRYLLQCLNDRGYLEFDLAELATGTNFCLFDLTQALFALQSLRPCGVGARSLSECLLLQLAESPFFNAHTIRTVKDGLELVAQNNMRALARLLGTTLDQAQACASVVRELNPIPSRGFAADRQAVYILPDAAVWFDGQSFQILMNGQAQFSVEVSREYLEMLAAAHKEVDGETKQFIRRNVAVAKKLQQAVDERNRTLRRVIEYIVSAQAQYFIDGHTLCPMTLGDAAQALGLHISTISRAVHEKYLTCGGKIIRIRSLFESAVSASGLNVSQSTAKLNMERLIAAESPAAPLTDDDLQAALAAAGIDVSRRTVAKYRVAMGIEKACRRKRQAL